MPCRTQQLRIQDAGSIPATSTRLAPRYTRRSLVVNHYPYVSENSYYCESSALSEVEGHHARGKPR